MKKLISRNLVQRFKQGGIPKLQTAWSPINFFDQAAEDYQRRQERQTRRAAGDTRAKKNTVSKLQDALWNIGAFKGIKTNKGQEVNYEQAVDGLTGRMTRAAIARAKGLGYDVDENTGTISNALSKLAASERSRIWQMQQTTPKEPVKRNTGLASMREMTHAARTGGMSSTVDAQKSQGRDVENIIDFISNNPAIILAEDIDRATSNKYFEKLLGIRPFKGRVITSLPSMQTEELKKQVQYAKSKGKGYFDSSLHKDMYGYNYASSNGENNQDRSGFWNRINTPKGRLEHTLGAYTFYEDKDGNTIVEDVYDFNVGQKQMGEGKYAKTRNWAGEVASKSTDPNEGKIKYRINLGKI